MLKKASRVNRPHFKGVGTAALRNAAAGLTLPLLLSACAVGPDWFRPTAPDNAGLTAEPLPATTVEAAPGAPAGGAQKFVSGAPVTADWWSLFGSPQLDALVAEALKHSPTLEAADATMRQAQELYESQFGSLFPSVDGSFSQTRQKTANTFPGRPATTAPYSVSTAQVQVSYAIDLFGEARRAAESTKAQAERAKFQKEAAQLSLTANVVTAAIQNAALRAQIQATEAVLDALNQQLGLLRRQLELGAVAEADVVTESVLVAQTQAQLPPLQRALAQNRNLLLALVGRYPSEALPGETGRNGFDIASIRLPEQLPVSLPSQLVDQRPDVRVAEAALHAASADVGVATAELLPKIPLTASFGTSSNDIGDLFQSGTGFWNLGLSALQPIFRGGALLHQKKAAEAAFDAARAQYRGTVIGAFQNVADSLRALEADAHTLRAQTEAERAAASNLEIAKNAYDTGATSFLNLLDAQRTYQSARVALVQAQANRYADTAALFAALGGGWCNRPDAPSNDSSDQPRKAEAAQ